MSAENTTSKAFPQFNNFFTDMTAQNIERMTAMYDEWAKLEKKAIVQASNSVDEMAKLMKASIDYATSLNDQMRDLTVDTLKKAQERA